SGAKGPFAGFYHDLAGTTFANWAFMLGLLGIGTALLLGVGMRIAAVAGALLMTMMYTVILPPTTNPVIDDHLILAVLLIGLAAAGAGRTLGLGRSGAPPPLAVRRVGRAAAGAGRTLGLGRWWAHTRLVKRLPWLT